jgi:isopenicillin-N N-acyltransferase like protein
MTMADYLPEIVCYGTPEAIGRAHGTIARARIHTSIRNYTRLFQDMASISWSTARSRASAFLDHLERSVPELVAEMRGIATGAEVDFLDILTLNVRSEIALTTFSDGCTSIAQAPRNGSGAVFIAQNWDWVGEAAEAMVLFDIQRVGGNSGPSPRIQMLGEAGLVGKFGFNDRGVAICMNAIQAEGLDVQKLPVHVVMRKSLECSSFEEVIDMLNQQGVASTVNLMLADATGSIATVECSPRGNVLIKPNEDGIICHTNHLYAEGMLALVKDRPSDNSFSRLARIQELARNVPPSLEGLRRHLSDRDGAPTAICRSAPVNAVGMQRTETLATMIMDVRELKAEVSLGQPNLNPPIKILTLQRSAWAGPM